MQTPVLTAPTYAEWLTKLPTTLWWQPDWESGVIACRFVPLTQVMAVQREHHPYDFVQVVLGPRPWTGVWRLCACDGHLAIEPTWTGSQWMPHLIPTRPNWEPFSEHDVWDAYSQPMQKLEQRILHNGWVTPHEWALFTAGSADKRAIYAQQHGRPIRWF